MQTNRISASAGGRAVRSRYAHPGSHRVVSRHRARVHRPRLVRFPAVSSDTVVTTTTTEEATSVEKPKEEYPGNGLDWKAPDSGEKFWTNFKLAFALPWRRFKSDAVLTISIDGEISDQLGSRFNPTVSVPQICQSLRKAALDPRIVGVCIEVGPLAAGWGKVMEIREHLKYFRDSGKFSIAFMKQGAEKEYYLATGCEEVYIPPTAYFSLRGLSVSGTFLREALEKVGVEPQVKRFGKYKSAGDQLLRRDMSEPQREQLSELLDDIYGEFVTGVAQARGKSEEEVRAMLDEGIFDNKKFAEGGWVDALKYEDEIETDLKGRTGGKPEELRKVQLRKYANVNPSAFGLTGGKKTVAIIRAAGAIVGGKGSATSSGSITAASVITKLRAAEKDKKVAAVVLRVDSPGGDALTSDLMWREIRRLAEKKPVVASMGDVAASGGYYMAMGAGTIVAEPLTITGSIGVVTGKLNLSELYKKIGYGKETISRGKFAEVMIDNRPFTAEEEALFDASAAHAYASFRNRAAESRGMEIEAMQEVAQGRVWSGKRALEVGLVDALGGVSRAVEIAKQKAGVEAGEKVQLVEYTRARGSPLKLLGVGASTTTLGTAFMFAGQALLARTSPEVAMAMAAMMTSAAGSLGSSTAAGPAALLMAALQPGPVKYLMMDVDALSIGSSFPGAEEAGDDGVEFLSYDD